MLVMGGTVGAGIFINPYVVAQRVHTPALVLGAWLLGGIIALIGALVWAELADRMPNVGGQYAYLRDVYHPLVAFLYGWVLLLLWVTPPQPNIPIRRMLSKKPRVLFNVLTPQIL